MTESKRALAALKVPALFFKAIINLVKSINVATRQMNKFNKLLKQLERRRGMKRDKSVQEGIDTFAKKAFGRSQSKSEKKGALMAVCVFCGKPIDPKNDFRNAISLKEFTISGICQACQDGVFGKD